VSAERVAVITAVSGRHDHLRNQRTFLADCVPAPFRHVVVAIGDPDIAGLIGENHRLPTTLVELPRHPAGLPIAAARNAGARAALAAGAEVLIFLDVDCLPSRELVGAYTDLCRQRPGDLLCGTVTYLPPTPAGGWDAADLARLRAPHPARPDPAPGAIEFGETRLFWSLSFAVTAPTWRAIGEFYEGYVGYGAEDTDFGLAAEATGARVAFAGGADAYHQHHPVSDPPVEHLDDIVRNSAVFEARHDRLPMSGWLDAFSARGLLTYVDGRPRRADAVRVATVPARHPYLDAALPSTVHRVAPERVLGWEPDPLFDPVELTARAGDIDVVHVHFAYEHLQRAELEKWLETLHELQIPLVLTVHDLHNPHQRDPTHHLEQLQLLGTAAARVVTLTDDAARACAALLDRPVEVAVHPTLLDTVPPPDAAAAKRGVLVPLKALRANVVDAVRLIEAVADAARQAGEPTRVLLEPSTADRPEYAPLQQLADTGAIELLLEPYLPEDALLASVAATRVLVLPYRFGTHSGWVELARDLGTRVVAPDCGSYPAQNPDVVVYGNNERDGLDADSLASAVRRACEQDAPAPARRAARLAQRDLVRAFHDQLYRDLARP
jgi:GT2 family glycosyltransferase